MWEEVRRATACTPTSRCHQGGCIHPLPVLLDEVDEPLHGLPFWNIKLHRLPADVEIDLVRGSTHVAEVRIGHFARAIDDAAHHGDAHALEMAGGGADFLGRRLEIE